ncbi:MAG: DUF4468 domain-containing protein [Bacteroidaceae bacterium]|nr:DUF4468 domain-containing protein [Bacteroidaceae bacterium]
MKKIILILLLLMPVMAMAQKVKEDKNAPKYLKGAVPVENGIVTFSKTFCVPGQTDAQLYENMLFYVKDNLVVKGIEDAWTRMLSEGKEDGVIAARVEEWMVFSKKFLSLDQTRFRYQINVTTGQGAVKITLTQVSYLYGEEWHENKPTGMGGEIYRAEEWITDEHALNKKGTKVLSGSGKFRRKTIDRVNEIFENAMDMFEEKVKEEKSKQQETKVQKRQFVVE